MQTIDTMIYIRDRLDQAQRSALQEQLHKLNGVSAPRFGQGKAPMLLLAYNTDVIDSAGVLGAISKMGLDARLVGL